MRYATLFGASLLVLGGCGGFGSGCGSLFDECDNDFDCAEDEICDYGRGIGLECVAVRLCDDGCSAGEACVTRPSVGARNPFESFNQAKRVCECSLIYCAGTGGSGAEGGSGGSGGATTTTATSLCGIVSPSGDPLSSARFGDPDAQGGALLAIADQAGEPRTMIAFPFAGTVDLGSTSLVSAGDTDVALIVRDGADEILFSHALGTPGAEMPTALAGSVDRFVLATSFTGTLEIPGAALDAGAGAASALLVITPDSVFSPALVLRADQQVTVTGVHVAGVSGALTVAGTFSGQVEIGDTTLTSGGGTDGFVAQIDLNTKSVAWVEQLSGPGDQDLTSVTVTAEGEVVAAGSFEGLTDLDGGQIASDGQDGLVWRFKPGGLHLLRTIGGPERQAVTAVAAYGSSSVVLTGVHATTAPSTSFVTFGSDERFVLPGVGAVDTFVATFDGAEFSMARLFSGPPETGEVTPRAIAFDCERHITVAGSATGGLVVDGAALPGIGKTDTFVLKVDLTGKPLWGKLFGGPEDDGATSVAVRGNKDILIGGSFSGAASFGAGELQSAGGQDTYVLRLSP